MGAVAGIFGLGGGEGGTGIEFQQAYSPEQMAQAYQQTQASMQQQQDLINAIKAQQGLANQSQIYGQLQDVIAGRGPNPAQAMLAQATGQNVAQQAALMAGQRGAGANVGLMARQASRAGADVQQQAAQQAALLQAQQSLGALGQAQNLATQQAQQQIGTTEALMRGRLGQQQGIGESMSALNQARAGIAQQRAGAFGNILGGAAQGAATALMLKDGGLIPTSTSAQSPKSSVGRFMSNYAQGGDVGSQLKAGGHVPGKASVKGDSLKNDTVHAMLSPGEIVIPRSIAMGKDAPRKSADFVAAVLAKKGIMS